MRTLYIDTHFLDVHLLFFVNGEIKRRKDIINVKNNSEFIMPSIKEICAPEEIDEIIVINGPGSFTGVRLGVTIAKTLAYTLNKPIKTLTYFEVLYASNNKINGIYAISDNNGYYICDFNNTDYLEKSFYVSNKEYDNYCINKDIFKDIEPNYNNIFEYSKAKDCINPHFVNPIYIKLIGAQK